MDRLDLLNHIWEDADKNSVIVRVVDELIQKEEMVHWLIARELPELNEPITLEGPDVHRMSHAVSSREPSHIERKCRSVDRYLGLLLLLLGFSLATSLPVTAAIHYGTSLTWVLGLLGLVVTALLTRKKLNLLANGKGKERL